MYMYVQTYTLVRMYAYNYICASVNSIHICYNVIKQIKLSKVDVSCNFPSTIKLNFDEAAAS